MRAEPTGIKDQNADWLLPLARMSCWCIIAYLLVAIVFSLRNTFVFNEIHRFAFSNAMTNGYAMTLDDFRRSLDWAGYDGVPRARILSALFDLLDAKLKIWAAGKGVFLPSLSLTWPLVFVIGPIMLWQIIRAQLHATAAWVGVCFYLTASSVLSSASSAMHAGKPLVIFFSILILWFYMRLQNADRQGASVYRKLSLAALILVSHCFALLSDEVALSLVGVAPVLFFEFVWRRPAGRLALFASLLSLPLFFAWVKFWLPALVEMAGFAPFVLASDGLTSQMLVQFGDPTAVMLKAGWTLYAGLTMHLPGFDLIGWHLVPSAAPVYPVRPEAFPDALVALLPIDPRKVSDQAVIAWAIASAVLFSGFAAYWASRQRAIGMIAFKALVAIGGIAVMQSLILLRNSFGYGMFYQGSIIALPAAMLMASLFAAPSKAQIDRVLRSAVFAIMLLAGIWNHLTEMRFWASWDGQGGQVWLISLKHWADRKPIFEKTRRQVTVWGQQNGIPARDISLFDDSALALQRGDDSLDYKLRHKMSLSVVMNWQPDLQPECAICVVVSADGPRAVRLKGPAQNLEIPAFLKDVPLIRGDDWINQ